MEEDLDFFKDEIGFEIRKLHLLLNREFEKLAKKDFPTKLQLAVILFMIHKSDKGENVYQKDIEKQFNIRASTTTNFIRKMEEDKLIVRIDSKNDKRLKKLVITDKARATAEEWTKVYREIKAKISKGITEEERKFFCNIIRKIQNNIKEA